MPHGDMSSFLICITPIDSIIKTANFEVLMNFICLINLFQLRTI